MYSYMQSIPYHRDNSMVMVLKIFPVFHFILQAFAHDLREIRVGDTYFHKAISPTPRLT